MQAMLQMTKLDIKGLQQPRASDRNINGNAITEV
jgi:hypothetical protein